MMGFSEILNQQLGIEKPTNSYVFDALFDGEEVLDYKAIERDLDIRLASLKVNCFELYEFFARTPQMNRSTLSLFCPNERTARIVITELLDRELVERKTTRSPFVPAPRLKVLIRLWLRRKGL